ncbi:MAG: methyltransferase [Synergistaceae bacterium]|jgi:tRNA1(Val) A37 N6-methylase TrmN6|nr:methyltransferase [Synergistaceae bacterium]
MPNNESAAAPSKIDDILYGALKMYQPKEGAGPRVNVDTILLAYFARLPRRARAIELGCAQGAVSLILAKKRREERRGHDLDLLLHPAIDAIDIDADLIELARRNAELNGLSGDVSFFASDLREHRKNFAAGVYDVVVMNPPYDEQGRSRPSPNDAVARAKHGESCSLAEVVAAAKFLLRDGGKFFLVMRAKRTSELFVLLSENNIRPKRLLAVHPKPERDASVVLVEAVRASGEGLIIEPPLLIYGEDGEYTEKLLAAYRMGECRS